MQVVEQRFAITSADMKNLLMGFRMLQISEEDKSKGDFEAGKTVVLMSYIEPTVVEWRPCSMLVLAKVFIIHINSGTYEFDVVSITLATGQNSYSLSK